MRSFAFTLIELLVVIGIIAVLAALIFPVFAQARVASQKTVAISNARQIAAGELAYQTDADDRYVPYFSGYVVNDPANVYYYPPLSYWPQTLSPYIQPLRLPQGQAQALIQDLPKVFTDPIKGFVPQDPKLWPLGNISSWGISDDIVQWYGPPHVQPSKISVSGSAVVSPSDCLMLTETWDVFSPGHNLAGSALAESYFDTESSGVNGAMKSLDSPYQASFRKDSEAQEPDQKGRNITVFCDGHTKAVVTGSLTRSAEAWSVGNNAEWP